ncbi:S24 family peptidase [Sphingomonas sp. ID0503]|uniref:S24 family peptidase n=1 Tax=Sphingomonas sp. ID0503 TaxID=3399691 RepID=UPI003AFA54D2
MAEVSDPRKVLEAFVDERRADYAGLSRVLGRNPAYIQQFVKRGVPKKLDEADRRTLARYLGIDEALLGGPTAPPPADLVTVDRLDVRASAGLGIGGMDDRPLTRIAFSRAWLRDLTGGRTEGLSIIEVRGDSMEPTLSDGDEILVERLAPGDRPRDGITVLRQAGEILVKRLSVDPVARRYTIRSDNPRYEAWTAGPGEIEVLGRVIWAGRRVR